MQLRGICCAELLNFLGFGVSPAPSPSAFPVSLQESQRGAGDPAAGHEDFRGLHSVLVLDHHVSMGQNSGISGVSQSLPRLSPQFPSSTSSDITPIRPRRGSQFWGDTVGGR